MSNRIVSQRHRPSLGKYFVQNFKTSVDITARARAMVTLGLLFLSGILAFIGYLAAPELNNILNQSDLRIAFGLALFLVFQFGVFTPCRMWRDAVWVQNVEESLAGLYDLHEEGTAILNEDVTYMNDHPNWEKEIEATNQWVGVWLSRVDAWNAKTEKALASFSPLDARRFKLVVTFEYNRIPGIPGNRVQVFRKNLLATKLERLGNMLEKHHPAQLPE